MDEREGDDELAGGAPDRGLPLKAAAQATIALALQVGWLPLAAYMLEADWRGFPSGQYAPVFAFLLGCSLAGIALMARLFVGKGRKPVWGLSAPRALIQVFVFSLGALGVVVSQTASVGGFGAEVLGLSLLLTGAGFGVGLVMACLTLMDGSRNQVALAACAMVLSWSASFYLSGNVGLVVAACVALLANAGSLMLVRFAAARADAVCDESGHCSADATPAAASSPMVEGGKGEGRPAGAVSRKAPGRDAAEAGEGASIGSGRSGHPSNGRPSNLYRDRRISLLARFWASLCIMSALSAMMVGFFAGFPTASRGFGLTPSILGVVMFAVLIGLGWIRKREFDFPFSFSLLTLVALLAFFPFYPGSEFNQWLAVLFTECWVLCLFGMLVPMLWQMRSPVRRCQEPVCVVGCSAMFVGLLAGALVFVIVRATFWDGAGLDLAFDRTLVVTLCGNLSIAATYVCTNVLIDGRRIRTVNLLAKGRFEMLLTTSASLRNMAGEAVAPSPSPAAHRTIDGATFVGIDEPTLVERCRLITLECKLTPREFDVLVLLAQGNGLAKVQEDLYISKGTAITHRRNIYRKLDVHSRQELVTYVADFGGAGVGNRADG